MEWDDQDWGNLQSEEGYYFDDLEDQELVATKLPTARNDSQKETQAPSALMASLFHKQKKIGVKPPTKITTPNISKKPARKNTEVPIYISG